MSAYPEIIRKEENISLNKIFSFKKIFAKIISIKNFITICVIITNRKLNLFISNIKTKIEKIINKDPKIIINLSVIFNEKKENIFFLLKI